MNRRATLLQLRAIRLSREWVVRTGVLATVLGVLGFAASFSPSLLPRPAWLQGLIAGLSAAIWYGAGVALDSIVTRVNSWAGMRVIMRPAARRVLVRV